MIPLTFLYDEYIDRPKLTEQKKPIWVYSSSPHKWGRNNYTEMTDFASFLFTISWLDPYIRKGHRANQSMS